MLLPKFVKKEWGWEYWFANVSDLRVDGYKEPYCDEAITTQVNYCGKILFVEHNKWSSNFRFHYHNIKDETFVVLEGILQIDYVDDHDNLKSIYLNPLQTFRVKPGIKHRFTSVTETGCKFIESSTFHSDEDSYRCEWDLENGGWKEV